MLTVIFDVSPKFLVIRLAKTNNIFNCNNYFLAIQYRPNVLELYYDTCMHSYSCRELWSFTIDGKQALNEDVT